MMKVENGAEMIEMVNGDGGYHNLVLDAALVATMSGFSRNYDDIREFLLGWRQKKYNKYNRTELEERAFFTLISDVIEAMHKLSLVYRPN